MAKRMSSRQEQILDFITTEVRHKGYPPSVREIGSAVGLLSSSTVHAHLRKLEDLGHIRRDPTKPRAIELLSADDGSMPEVVHVPVVGQVTAGEPILAVENIEEYFPLPKEYGEKDVFILRIKGDSMIEAGIHDRDYVVIQKQPTAKNGEIIVGLIDDEATVKRFFHEGDRIRLQPENPSMAPIYVNEVSILGKVVGLYRRIH